jgi:hypothetical protein
MRYILFITAIVSLMTIEISATTAWADSQNDAAGILDDMVFIGHVGPKGGDVNGEDEVVFENGQFLSTSCSKYGFGTATYIASRDGDNISFTATTRSPKHGQIEWQGKIVGKEIEASYIWTKERWYWFDAYEENWLKARLKKD